MVKYIPLSKGMVAIIDDCDYELVSQYKWHVSGSTKDKYYARSSNRGNPISMHRLLTEASSSQEVDHINQNRLDNRRSNLRLCNRSENNRNLPIRSDNTSGYKGVSNHKPTGKWRARVYIDSKSIYLGLFDSPLEAAIAYNHGAKKHYGEFARLNNIPNWESKIPDRILRSDNKSGYRGVSKCNNKWRSMIAINGVTIHLGYFDNQIDAAIAYDIAAYKQYGKFAITNFPIENYEES